MYQIVGTQTNGRQQLVARPSTAHEARLEFYRQASRFQTVAIIDPWGEAIDHSELSQREMEERNAPKEG